MNHAAFCNQFAHASKDSHTQPVAAIFQSNTLLTPDIDYRKIRRMIQIATMAEVAKHLIQHGLPFSNLGWGTVAARWTPNLHLPDQPNVPWCILPSHSFKEVLM